jgi:hypothetical protein
MTSLVRRYHLYCHCCFVGRILLGHAKEVRLSLPYPDGFICGRNRSHLRRSLIDRIPLAKLMIQTTIDISKHHISVYVVVIIGLIVQTAWSVYYAITVVGIYVTWTPDSAACASTSSSGSCSSSKVAGLIFFATFAYYWVSQVIANVVLTTLSGGVFGGWYYFGPRSPHGGVPKGATFKAFARSVTYNLGSIAFGSLIVTILELLRLILNAVAQNARAEGDSKFLLYTVIMVIVIDDQ